MKNVERLNDCIFHGDTAYFFLCVCVYVCYSYIFFIFWNSSSCSSFFSLFLLRYFLYLQKQSIKNWTISQILCLCLICWFVLLVTWAALRQLDFYFIIVISFFALIWANTTIEITWTFRDIQPWIISNFSTIVHRMTVRFHICHVFCFCCCIAKWTLFIWYTSRMWFFFFLLSFFCCLRVFISYLMMNSFSIILYLFC